MKKSVIFSGADIHGMTMGATSLRNMRKVGYDSTLVCQYPETLKPRLFWGQFFIEYDFTGISEVAVCDIPVPEPDGTFPNAVRDALAKIRELVAVGTKVVIVDHHTATESHYGVTREAGAEMHITTCASTCYWGDPSEYSEFWGRIGAISDRDDAVLPVEPDELRFANGLEVMIRNDFDAVKQIILNDERNYQFANVRFPEPIGEAEVIGHCLFVSETTPKFGFKQLDQSLTDMPAKSRPEYGVSVDCSRGFWRVLAITYWQSNALPVALRLGLTRFIGHSGAIVINVAPESDINGKALATKHALELIGKINSKGVLESEGEGFERGYLFSFISEFMRKVNIPFFLTQHGWPHVQRVIANARTLGGIFNLTEDEMKILDFVALFHDTGNGANTYYPDAGLSDKEARKRHHEFSFQMVREWHAEGLFEGVLSNEEVDVIAELCFAHRKKVDMMEENQWVKLLPFDERLRLLCTVFRVADGMDIDSRRAQSNDAGVFFEDLDLPEDSVQHWEGHRAIEALRIIAGKELTFELVVTDSKMAEFQVREVTGELSCLTALDITWNLRVVKKN